MKCDYMSKVVKRMIKVKQDSALTGRGQVHSITQTPSVIIRYVVPRAMRTKLSTLRCTSVESFRILVWMAIPGRARIR